MSKGTKDGKFDEENNEISVQYFFFPSHRITDASFYRHSKLLLLFLI